jgi:hypothetical protein
VAGFYYREAVGFFKKSKRMTTAAKIASAKSNKYFKTPVRFPKPDRCFKF